MAEYIDRDALYTEIIDRGIDGLQLDDYSEIQQVVADAPAADVISKQAVLDALERERECLLANGMDGAEHILVHHAIRVIEEFR